MSELAEKPRTAAGRRLLWMFELERNGEGRILTRAFEARLTRRIIEDFVVRIEREASEDVARYTPEELVQIAEQSGIAVSRG